MWSALRNGKFRKAAGPAVVYPTPYASNQDIAAAETPELKQKLYLHNCAQRAHSNFQENYTIMLPAMLIAGLHLPRAAAAAGIIWTFFRLRYAIGYTRVDKEKGLGRYDGLGFWFAQLALIGMSGFSGYKLFW